MILMFLPRAVSAETAMPDDSTSREASLGEVVVTGHRVNSYLKSGGNATVIDLGMLDFMPQIMGNADPVHNLQLMPGVHTNSEYDAGIYINGCDNSHNDVTINGVTLYNVEHLLGFFSVFNSPHFSSMSLQRQSEDAADASRLGGFIDIRTADTVARRLSGTVSAGPLSSQGTVRIPVGRRSSLTVSARAAYMNLLYSKWLRHDGEQYHYSFSDYNLNYLFTPSSRDKLWLDAYYGDDRAGINSRKGAYDASANWGNDMAALHWQHSFSRGVLYQRLSTSGYRVRPRVNTSEYAIKLPSSVRDWSYHAELIDSMGDVGLDVIYRRIQPQSPDADGTEFNVYLQPQAARKSLEMALYADKDVNLTRRLVLRGGVRLSAYHADGGWQWGADPNVSLRLRTGSDGNVRLSLSSRHQYIHRSGFTSMGLPTEFWFPADRTFRAQHGWTASLGYEGFALNRYVRFSAEVYYKQLYRQVEYTGSLFDMLYDGYEFANELSVGKGRNFGVNLQLEKRRGAITGWISYSWGRSLRRFHGEGIDSEYPSNHERIHELNEVAMWRIGRRWEVGQTFVLASGTPFTTPEYFYFIGQNLVSKYAPHNSNRLSAYMRLDLSASYKIRLAHPECGFNLSVYNATGHKNDLYYRLKFHDGDFAYRAVTFVTRVLPSISFYVKF